MSHAILRPSAAHRWLTCAPSARFEQQLPNSDTDYSQEGTLAHELAALVLSFREGKTPDHIFTKFFENIRDKALDFYSRQPGADQFAKWHEMYRGAEEWAELVGEQVNGVYDLYIERTYDMSNFAPLCSGTGDAVVKTPKILYVNDYKYGAGVKVSAKENPQLKLYGLGALYDLYPGDEAPDTVVFVIHQPRVGGVSVWTVDTDELIMWGYEVVQPMGNLAISGMGEFVTGKHCQFCAARTSCAAWYKKFGEALDMKDARTISAEARATVLEYGDLVKTWINKVQDEAAARISRGEKIPGYKLVQGKGRRSFVNEDEVVDALIALDYDSDDIFTTSLKSLTEIETMIGRNVFKEQFAGNVHTIPGAPKVAAIDDDRQEITANAADDYDDENLG